MTIFKKNITLGLQVRVDVFYLQCFSIASLFAKTSSRALRSSKM